MIGPPRSPWASQNRRFGCPVYPRAAVAAFTLLPTKLPGSYAKFSSDRNRLPPLLIVEKTPAPGVFIVTSPPAPLIEISSWTK